MYTSRDITNHYGFYSSTELCCAHVWPGSSILSVHQTVRSPVNAASSAWLFFSLLNSIAADNELYFSRGAAYA